MTNSDHTTQLDSDFDDLEQRRRADAMALAELIYDIYREKVQSQDEESI